MVNIRFIEKELSHKSDMLPQQEQKVKKMAEDGPELYDHVWLGQLFAGYIDTKYEL